MRPYKTTVAFLMFSFSLALAQDSLTCLDKASAKIKPEDKITLLRKDGQQVTGRLLVIDLASSQVTIHTLDEASRMTWARISSFSWNRATDDTATLQGADLSLIKYYRYGQLRPMPILGGTLAGALVGALAGLVIGGSADFDLWGTGTGNNATEEGLRTGLLIGSVAGLIVGTIVSVATPTTRKIECE